MRILYTTPIYPPKRGGASTYFHLLTKWALSDPRFDAVYVLTTYGKKGKSIELQGKLRIFRILIQPSLRFPRFILLSNTVICVLFAAFFLLMNKYKGNFIIHGHTRKYFLPIYYLSSFINAKVVVDVRDLGGIAFMSKYFLSVKAQFIGCAPKYLVNNVFYRYIPVPVDLNELHFVSRNSEVHDDFCHYNYILIVSDINKNKGLDLISDHTLMLLNKHNLKLIVVGRILNYEIYEKIVKLGVVCKGELDRVEVLKYIKYSKGVWLLSRRDLYPRIIIEALFYQKRMLISDGVAALQSFSSYGPICSFIKGSPTSFNYAVEIYLSLAINVNTSYDFDQHSLQKLGNELDLLYFS